MNVRRLAPFLILFIFAIAIIQTGCDTLVTENNEYKIYDSSIAVDCFECHSEYVNSFNLRRAQGQFEHSAHANYKLLDVDDCNTACHTHEGYLALIDTLSGGTDPISTQLVSAITCYTCHYPHDANVPYGTWQMDTIRGFDVNPTFAYNNLGTDFGMSNNCANCHKATKLINTTTDDPDFGPHFSPQADIVSGRFAAFIGILDPTDENNALASSHFSNGCIKCHYGNTNNDDDGQGYLFAEHTFRLKDPDTDEMYFNTCQTSTCHNGNMNQDVIDSSQYLVAISALADTVQSFLEAFEILDPSDTTGRTIITTTTRTEMLDSALYNYLLYNYDNSYGIHNPIFVKQLLDTTKTILDSLPPLISFTTDTLNCLGTDVEFVPNIIGTFDSLIWLLGDTTIYSFDENPIYHSYDSAGVYTIALRAVSYYVRDSLEADTVVYDTVSGSVTYALNNYLTIEDSILSADFVLDTNGVEFTTPLNICIGDEVLFVSKSTFDIPPTYHWDFGYGNEAASLNDTITHTFDTIGTLSPTLIVTTNCYSDTFNIPNLITVSGAKAIIDPLITEDYATFSDSVILTLNHLSIGSVDTTMWIYRQPDVLTQTDTSIVSPLVVTYPRPATDSTFIQFILRVTSNDVNCTNETKDTLTYYIQGIGK